MSVVIVWQDLICSFTLLQLEALLMSGQSAEGLKKNLFFVCFFHLMHSLQYRV